MKFTYGGGINELNDIAIAPDEAISGQNFELGLGNTKLKRRKPFDFKATALNEGEIHGIHQLIERDGTKTTLVAAGTDMYEWSGGNEKNLLTYSEQFDNAAWLQINTPVITPDTDVAPDTTTTADTVAKDSAVSGEYIYQAAGGTFDSSKPYTFSLFGKKDATAKDTRFCAIYLEFRSSTVENNRFKFDTSTGEYLFTEVSSEVNGAVEDYSATWWRVWISAKTADAANTEVRGRIYPAAGASTSFIENAGITGSFIIWGAQINQGATPDEYLQSVASITSTFTDVGNVDADSEFHHVAWDLDERIVIVDRIKENVVLDWDGTTLTTYVHAIGGVTSFYAKYGIVQNGRLVFANITTDATANPHMLVFSEFENYDNLDTTTRAGDSSFTTGNEPFYILTPDLEPINGLVRFHRSTIISTEGGQLFELVGDDSTNYRFEPFYGGSGAVDADSFVNVGNDVFYMREGGNIESLRSTDTYGDVETDDLSLPIKETTKDLTSIRAVYDQSNQKVLFWTDSSVLVLFKNLINSDKSPWSIYKTAHASGFSTKAAVYMELPDSATKTILFGDSLGNIYDLNGEGLLGDGGTEDILTIRKMPLQEFDYENFLEGRVFYRRRGECELSLTFEWGDEKNTTNLVIPLRGKIGASNMNYFGGGLTPIYFGGGEYFGEGDPVGNPVSGGFSAIGKGSSVFATLQVDTVETFEIDYIETPE
ncbi:MAG: phage head spike fiber domain-containing protein [bacterium]